MNILIVDDTEISLNMAKLFIDHVMPGNDIDFAHDAEMAEKMVKTKKYDLIFSDLCMPGKNGDELAKFVSCEENMSSNAKIYICSSRNPNESEKNNIELYSSAFLQKPLTAETFQEILTNAS